MTRTVIFGETDSRRFARLFIASLHLWRSCWAAAVILVLTSLAHSQPPPVGPATYKSDKQPIGVGELIIVVKTMVQKIVDDTNTRLMQQGKATSH